MDEEPLLFRFALRVPAEDELLVEGGLGQIVNNMIAVVSSQQLFMLERKQHRRDRSWIRFLTLDSSKVFLLCGLDRSVASMSSSLYVVASSSWCWQAMPLEGIEQFLPLQTI